MIIELLNNKKSIFWDFDGVIKDSIKIKSNAYEELFLKWGTELSYKVRDHHKLNGGMSRFDKIPLYLSWTSENINKDLINKLCNDFSKLVKHKVINSPWVPGVTELLNYLNNDDIYLYIVTATPQDEIEEILYELQIDYLFKEIIGSPTTKSEAIRFIKDKYNILNENAVMIGDSKTDMDAAKFNSIDFILRKTDENQALQNQIDFIMVDDFK